MSPVGGTARYVWYVECGCPPYETVTASDVSTQARRNRGRTGRSEASGVNQAGSFTDNMWCRRGSTIVPGEVKTQGIRVEDDGI